MRGIKIHHTRLGKLMKQGRERRGLVLEEAAMLIGLTNGQYLWRCEKGEHGNFPARSVVRALELYGIAKADAITAICDDFKAATIEYLRKK
mgnify:CR=1 FL=1